MTGAGKFPDPGACTLFALRRAAPVPCTTDTLRRRRTPRSEGWTFVGLSEVVCVEDQVYFEVTVVKAAGEVCVAWVGTNFLGTAVGDAGAESWGVHSNGDKIHRQACPLSRQTLSRS